MVRRILASASLAMLVAGAAMATEAVDVYCGSFTPMKFRVSAAGKDPNERANQAMDVINKYLGGKPQKVLTKADGKNVKLMVQRDVVAVVTPADAQAEKAKSPAVLATQWSQRLTVAFKYTCALP